MIIIAPGVIGGCHFSNDNDQPTSKTYSISGVVNFKQSVLPGALMTLSGDGTGLVTTDSNGDYQFTGLGSGRYTVTPSLSGYIFTPESALVPLMTGDASGKSFTAFLTAAKQSRVPVTGQTTCYDSSGKIISCAGTGQDGEYSSSTSSSYTDNGDGTVTDKASGLVWQKQDDGTRRTWYDGSTYCNNNTPGLPGTGWRLPTLYDLLSIADFGTGQGQPTINTTYFPNTASAEYWSFNERVDNTMKAWVVLFFSGGTHDNDKTSTVYVRCVR
jgi:hypothetical protein